PLGHRLADRLLQTLNALTFLANPLKMLFECDALLAMLELLLHQPIHVGRPPRLLARIDASQPQHRRRDLLALALQVLLRCLTCWREIAHVLMPLVWHPDRGELADPQQLGEAYRIAPVRLYIYMIARFLRRKRRSYLHRA